MEATKIFDFTDYKKYVNFRLSQESERGSRSRLAAAMRCHLAYISQVLDKSANFTQEQALALAGHYELNEKEQEYFLLLVQRERAGTAELKSFYEQKIKRMIEKWHSVESRISTVKKLSQENQSRYYSSWQYIAVYILATIPDFQTAEAISQRLRISLPRTQKILEFLAEINLVVKNKKKFQSKAGTVFLTFLTKVSPFINLHHINWRLKAIQSLDREDKNDLHFSVLYSLSVADRNKLKKMILDFLETLTPVVTNSPEETAACLNIDWFEI